MLSILGEVRVSKGTRWKMSIEDEFTKILVHSASHSSDDNIVKIMTEYEFEDLRHHIRAAIKQEQLNAESR